MPEEHLTYCLLLLTACWHQTASEIKGPKARYHKRRVASHLKGIAALYTRVFEQDELDAMNELVRDVYLLAQKQAAPHIWALADGHRLLLERLNNPIEASTSSPIDIGAKRA